jgi:hypothetical protein
LGRYIDLVNSGPDLAIPYQMPLQYLYIRLDKETARSVDNASDVAFLHLSSHSGREVLRKISRIPPTPLFMMTSLKNRSSQRKNHPSLLTMSPQLVNTNLHQTTKRRKKFHLTFSTSKMICMTIMGMLGITLSMQFNL